MSANTKRVGRFASMGEALAWLKERRPFDVLLHPDGEFTVSGLGVPQCAVTKHAERELAEIIATALNQWAAGPASDAALEYLQGDFQAALARADMMEDAIQWALSGHQHDPPLAWATWRKELRRRAFGEQP